MKQTTLFITGLVLFAMYLMTSCADKLPEPSNAAGGLDCSNTAISYNKHIESILNRQCESAGCHDGAGLLSFGTYSSLSQARREQIYQRVAVLKNMPPAGTSAEVIDTISCWQSLGYPEN